MTRRRRRRGTEALVYLDEVSPIDDSPYRPDLLYWLDGEPVQAFALVPTDQSWHRVQWGFSNPPEHRRDVLIREPPAGGLTVAVATHYGRDRID